MINIVFDESNKQARDKILHMTVLTKDHELFHAYCEFAGVTKFTTYATAIWMLEKINQLTKSDFKKVNGIITDTRSFERAVWNILGINQCS